MSSQINGILRTDSELRRIWPDGMVPLKSPHLIDATLGTPENHFQGKVYLVDTQGIGVSRLDQLVDLLQAKGFSEKDAYGATYDPAGFPVLQKHFVGVAMPLRFFA